MSVTRAPQPIPDPNLYRLGQRPTQPTFFLRATPKPFTVLNVGGSNTNQDFAFRPASIPDYRQFIPLRVVTARHYPGARPGGLTITFDVEVASLAAVAGSLTRTRALSSTISAASTVTPTLVRVLRVLAASIASIGPATADLSGGSLAGELELTAEDQTGLTLTAETQQTETLAGEDSDTLTLTPA